MLLVDASVRDEKLELARLDDGALDRAAVGDVHLHPCAADLRRDRLDLLAAARPDDDLPAVARERPRDPRADAAAAAGDERSHSGASYRDAAQTRVPTHCSARHPLGVAVGDERDAPGGPMQSRLEGEVRLSDTQARARSRTPAD